MMGIVVACNKSQTVSLHDFNEEHFKEEEDENEGMSRHKSEFPHNE